MNNKFLEGFGSVLNVFPSHEEKELDFSMPKESTNEAFKKDWEAIGDDLLKVVGKERSK